MKLLNISLILLVSLLLYVMGGYETITDRQDNTINQLMKECN